jgi:hypothetical protein
MLEEELDASLPKSQVTKEFQSALLSFMILTLVIRDRQPPLG